MEDVEPVEPLRRAVEAPVKRRRMRWIYAAVAVSAISTTIAGVSALALVTREPPRAPAVRYVQLGGGMRYVPSTCDRAFQQFAVYRYESPQDPLEIAGPFGIQLRLTCRDVPGLERGLVRSAGPDRQFGTSDDTCFAVATRCPSWHVRGQRPRFPHPPQWRAE
jgi:hypothetical protein